MQLISEYNYYKDKETLTADGYFYSTVEHLENETCLSGHEQRKAIATLAELKILTVVSKGIPAKRHFKINFEAIAEIFNNLDKTSGKARNSKPLKILTASDKENKPQAGEKFNTNNKIYKDDITRLTDYINNSNLEAGAQKELEKEFERLEINLTDDFVQILSERAYMRLLFMRAGITSVFCSAHKYKLHYLTANKLITLFDRYSDVAKNTEINEPVKYFRKMLVEYLDGQASA